MLFDMLSYVVLQSMPVEPDDARFSPEKPQVLQFVLTIYKQGVLQYEQVECASKVNWEFEMPFCCVQSNLRIWTQSGQNFLDFFIPNMPFSMNFCELICNWNFQIYFFFSMTQRNAQYKYFQDNSIFRSLWA